MRRPKDLRNLGLTPYEYKLIGEIVILAGFIEQQMREIPLILLGIPRNSVAVALTAHLTVQSLSDMSLALLAGIEFDDSADRKSFQDAIKLAKDAYDRRNKIIHGPMGLYDDGTFGTRRYTARQKLRIQDQPMGRDYLKTLLADLSDTYEGLEWAISWLTLKRILLVRARD